MELGEWMELGEGELGWEIYKIYTRCVYSLSGIDNRMDEPTGLRMVMEFYPKLYSI